MTSEKHSDHSFNPLAYPITYEKPFRLLSSSAWIQHIPFGMFLVDLVKPRTLVELGTHSGVSYCAFCQAVKDIGLEAKCYAVDTWQGDQHAGSYGNDILGDLRIHHDSLYGDFSTLIQSTFDDAVHYFADSSIDLLHIDGLHTYTAVKHDFSTWLPKLSSRAVVILHDTNVRERKFGVWKLWNELSAQYPYVEFFHGHGLGLIKVGSQPIEDLDKLLSMDDKQLIAFRRLFFTLGVRLSQEVELIDTKSFWSDQVQINHQANQQLQQELQEARGLLDQSKADVENLVHKTEVLASSLSTAREYSQYIQDELSQAKLFNQKLIREVEEAKQRISQIEYSSTAQATLDAIYGSTGWKLLEVLYWIRLRIFPRGSRREMYGRRIFQGVLNLKRSLSRQSSSLSVPTIVQEPPTNQALLANHIPQQIETPDIIDSRFPLLRALRGFSSPYSKPRLNLVTDSINDGSLFGGVATSMILSNLIAERWGCDLRIITRLEIANKNNYDCVVKANKIYYPGNVEFLYADYFDPNSQIPVGDNEIFLTTSWWTTQGVKSTFAEKQIIYLLQEDERSFYPYGDDHLRCTDLLQSPDIRFVVNTELLYDHLVNEGFSNIKRNGLWFEPSWPENLFYYDNHQDYGKNNFFYYARPNNVRNVFYFGLEVIQKAILTGILSPDEWNIYFVGKDLKEITLQKGVIPLILQNLNWFDYANLVRKMDLGLSLMYTPHPSYPPIDLAASGAVVVTNRFGPKQDLSRYSKNILCCDLDLDQMVDGLAKGIALAKNRDERMRNYQANHINRDWRKSFAPVLDGLESIIRDV